ncbi:MULTISPECIES: M20/M25/M40 family metallo-hydrolase [Turicibacter]|uniref:M20/M25/M40 family metallo-hydrolase n=2 Tax=Turicibacter sanguinis TaxID=154288 RepID=A0A173TYP4_9FIRM|nr:MULTISPECIES: M20/M25/M40 family metallo-hydrolase [Turicibacter]EFF64346.1 peptidase family M20/M25/M40 [Turicibacter sanguinis PC909]EGC92751.1 M42 glutamyl aminopeptidase [Turicibacter sp. HGF1]MBP3904704.1 M20/M25/M40 family metallo-hydrolase [Turicibacter sp.]MCU7191733.1 M20/M25/M40 family metallo-hydrolase [Turicibacter sanguinis]MCU7202253.1 M20/M25/M40 family metallo-hydrolase [Turicibacter sanguinis]
MNKHFLYEMIQTASPSGKEFELQKKIMSYMQDTVDGFETDTTGNVMSILNKDHDFKVLLAGHVDEIGMMITMITSDGLAKVTNVGGIRPALYLGQKVRILTKNGIIGGVVGYNNDLLKNKSLETKDLFIDLGATSKEEALKVIAPGDYVVADTDYLELLNNNLAGRALDNRLGAFIVIEALRRAKELGTRVGVYSATTVGEETTMRGAVWAAKRVKPALALIVDVTFATDYPGTNPEVTGEIKLGGGPVLCHGSIINNHLNDALINIANRLNMPIQFEMAPGRTGTDGDRIHFQNDGVPLALISIPLRYMHSGSEVCHLNDVEQIIELIAHFLAELQPCFNLSPYA